ncbi:hypothetical protein WKH56_08795 [Priestia sp. SB1]|uniref:Uncharacterized protein n=1 Tax=Priestia aryabhattai TaxID=412384 RepID=A0AAX6NDH9_PRIAR|nr:hypothetical protein [Priestia aryabhattai]MDU9693961.1 hypothetical protein [Priestia aryabhattai]NGY88740.1 hypothetical protein [Priestia megaterium]
MSLNVILLTTERLLEIRKNSKAFIKSNKELNNVGRLLETHIKDIETELNDREVHYDERYPGPFGKYIKKEVDKEVKKIEKEMNIRFVKRVLSDGVSGDELKVILKYYPISEEEYKKLNIDI